MFAPLSALRSTSLDRGNSAALRLRNIITLCVSFARRSTSIISVPARVFRFRRVDDTKQFEKKIAKDNEHLNTMHNDGNNNSYAIRARRLHNISTACERACAHASVYECERACVCCGRGAGGVRKRLRCQRKTRVKFIGLRSAKDTERDREIIAARRGRERASRETNIKIIVIITVPESKWPGGEGRLTASPAHYYARDVTDAPQHAHRTGPSRRSLPTRVPTPRFDTTGHTEHAYPKRRKVMSPRCAPAFVSCLDKFP